MVHQTFDMNKPFMFLSVDGVINAFDRDETLFESFGWDDFVQKRVMGLTITYSPQVVDLINKLSDSVNILWLTDWRGYANSELAPAIGIKKEFPVADWIVDPTLGDDGLIAGSVPFSHDESMQPWHKSRVIGNFFLRNLSKKVGSEDVRIIWIDDDIDHKSSRGLKLIFPPQNSLIIVPSPKSGLTPIHSLMIKVFVNGDC